MSRDKELELVYREDKVEPSWIYRKEEILGPTPQMMICERNIPLDKLTKITDQIDFFQKMAEVYKDYADFGIEQVSYGYEEYAVVFTWTRPENKEELQERLNWEKYLVREKKKEERLKARQLEGRKEIARIKKKYGL